MIVNYNNYQGAAFFNTSNYYAGQILTGRDNIISYFELRTVNKQLAAQNAQLLEQLNNNPPARVRDTASSYLKNNPYEFISARVVKNTTRFPENYLTLNRGSSHGVEPDMGVIGPDGIVGRVKTVSANFSTVISMLHSGMSVASKIKNKEIDASVIWDGVNPSEGKVLHVVRHHKIAKGDSLITSEYNAVFPPGVMIGTIGNYTLGEGSSDYNIDVNFSTDFTSLSYVYIIKNKMRPERDSLESALTQ